MESNGNPPTIRVTVTLTATMPALPRNEPVGNQRSDDFAGSERPYFREVDRHKRGSHSYGDSRTFKYLDIVA
jgi:hypothetical protein